MHNGESGRIDWKTIVTIGFVLLMLAPSSLLLP